MLRDFDVCIIYPTLAWETLLNVIKIQIITFECKELSSMSWNLDFKVSQIEFL